MSAPNPASPYTRLRPIEEDGETYRVVVETPRGSRHKYDFEEELGLFVLGGVLPIGAVFPYDFGFLPATLGEDGDPLDVLLLLDDTCFTGCVVPTRFLGAVEAEQTERDGRKVRNDRLIGVSTESQNHEHITTLEQLGESVLEEIEHFFVSYNESRGKKFEPLGRVDAERAAELVREGMEMHRRSRGG